MGLTLTAFTRDNITRVDGTVASGAGGSASVTIFPRPNPQVAPPYGHVSEERVAVKLIRLVGTNTAAGDYFSLTSLGTAESGVFVEYEYVASGDNFVDTANIGDEFRDGLILNATTAATTNDASSAKVFALYLYHTVKR